MSSVNRPAAVGIVVLFAYPAWADDAIITGKSSLYPSRSGNKQPDTAIPRTNWNDLTRSSLRFLAVQHGFRLLTEPATRSELAGPFVRDYLRSARRIRGWGDQDPFIVNYVGHPMMGAITGELYIAHTTGGLDKETAFSRRYWKLAFRGMAFSAVYTAQFELGPVSEASIGNVGYDYRTMGAVDLVMTPIGGTAWIIAEDSIDRFLVRRIEQGTSSPALRATARCLLNPARTFANVMSGQAPWKRSRPLR
jgi:hypothetical protein